MVKVIQVPVEDAEYERLIKNKGDDNWHDFFMQLAEDDPTIISGELKC